MTYNPATNCVVEAFNKTIINILMSDWDDQLDDYIIIVQTLTGTIPYSLVYGRETVLSLEIQIPSLQMSLAMNMMTEENHKCRLEELEVLNEKQLQVQQHIKLYQAKIRRPSTKQVKERILYQGDLVITVRQSMAMTHNSKGKFNTKCGGLFITQIIIETEHTVWRDQMVKS